MVPATMPRVLFTNNFNVYILGGLYYGTAERNAEKELSIGQRFGKLTILKKTDKRQGKFIIYECQCDCGRISYASSSDLIQGHSKSCGCGKSEFLKEKALLRKNGNLVGKKFGRLTVIERTEKRWNSQVVYRCKCECGNICDVPSSSLVTHGTQSCGCFTGSIGEEKISKILRDNNLPFEREKTFTDCINQETNAHFRFDFFVNSKYIIEFDGIQHFKAVGGWGTEEALKKVQASDNYKNQYCIGHNIPLIRIPYTRLENICLNDLILETSKFIFGKENYNVNKVC